MGVYIKDMEMPTSCNACELAALVDISDGLAYGCRALKEMIYNDRERLPNCPLVPVPPHGRLIDADALLADVRAHSESYFADDFAHEWVDVAPTVIEAESYSERELQRDYEASVEYAQHCGRYEPTYYQDTGAM